MNSERKAIIPLEGNVASGLAGNGLLKSSLAWSQPPWPSHTGFYDGQQTRSR